MDRRDFIKTSCTLCLALSTELMMTTLSSCVSFPEYMPSDNGKSVVIPNSVFAQSNIYVLSVKGVDYNIAVKKEPDGDIIALLLRCTHASTPLNFTGKEFLCPLHFSSFDEEGNVTMGPATHPLRRLDNHVSGDNIIISIQ